MSTRQQRDGAAIRPNIDRDGVPWCSAWRCAHFQQPRCELRSKATDETSACIPAVEALVHERDMLVRQRIEHACKAAGDT